jgi:hypothetical protein
MFANSVSFCSNANGCNESDNAIAKLTIQFSKGFETGNEESCEYVHFKISHRSYKKVNFRK